MSAKLISYFQIEKIPSLIYRSLLCIFVFFNLNPCISDIQTNIYLFICIIVFLLYYTYKAFKIAHPIPYHIDIIIDILFACTILFIYNQWDWYSGSFIYLMLLCIENESHFFHRTFILFLGVCIPMYLFFMDFSMRSALPIFIFCFFFYIDHYVSVIYEERNSLNNIIDEFFISSNNGKSYTIFRDSIKLFQDDSFRTQIIDIFCFRKKENEDGLYLVNGTKFLWGYSLLEDNQNLATLLEDTGFKQIKIEIDGFDGYIHDCFVYRDNAISYIYVLLMKPNSVLKLTFFKKYMFTQFFTRMSRIIESEYSIKEKRIKGLQEIKQKMTYVTMATTTMHFIRNKLSPLKSYIAFMDDYSKSDAEKKNLIRPYLDDEFEKVKKSMDLILNRANFLLEESENPFLFSQTEKFGPQKLFSDIKLIWQSYGLDETRIHVSISDKVKGLRKYVYYNINGLNIVLDNWISNIYRYNDGFYQFKMIEQESSFVLEFINNFNLENREKNNFSHILKIYNENNKAEITKKNYHGLNEIRDYLAQMNITSKLENRDNNVVFTIILFKETEIHEEENPNN